MAAWSSYRLSDFLLFSERAYWPLFEGLNASLWPAQILVLLLGAVCLALAERRARWTGWTISLVLAGAWSLTAWAFLWARYADINWAIPNLLPLFAGQAILLLTWGFGGRVAFSKTDGAPRLTGLALAAYALVLHPLVPLLDGRPLASAEVFALAPLPTALFTLGLLALAGGGWRLWLLRLVPLAWCALETLTLAGLGTWEAWIAGAGGLIGLAAPLLRRRNATT